MALSGGGCNLQVIVVPIYAIQAYGLQGQVQLLRCDFSQAMDWSGKNLSSGGPKKRNLEVIRRLQTMYLALDE